MNRNNRIVILGGTSGIGFETARRFVKNHKVIIVGRDRLKGKKAAQELKVVFVQVDITNFKSRKLLVELLSNESVSKIVHTAGIFKKAECLDYRNMYRETKFGGIKIIKDLVALGGITHACTVSSLYTFLSDSYSFVPSFERSVQVELEHKTTLLGNSSLVANCVAPGLTKTPLVKKAYSMTDIDNLLRHSPGSRVIEPKEVAEVVYWLMNQVIVNRSVIPVDGGFLRFLQK